MAILSVEQREEIRKAGGAPIRIDDPETRETYILLRADVFDGLTPRTPVDEGRRANVPFAEGIRRARAAFLHDLPALLAPSRLRGRWVLYHLDRRIGIWRSPRGMLRKIVKLALPEDEIYFGTIDPQPDELEEAETSLFEFEEIESAE